MPYVLFCQELGSGWGHLQRLAPLIDQLHGQRIALGLAVGDQQRAGSLFAGKNVELFTTPSWPAPPEAYPFSLNYADNLWRNGYHDPEELRRHLRFWRELFERLRPALIVAEHAPTVLLASRGMDIPRVTAGSGFSLPPLEKPMPAIQPWFDIDRRLLDEKEQRLVEQINRALTEPGAQELKRLSDLFAGAVRLMCTFRELDHYGARKTETYRGVIWQAAKGAPAEWPRGRLPRLFMYLNGGLPRSEAALRAAAASGHATLACVRDAPPEVYSRYRSDTVALTGELLNIEETVTPADRAVVHGGIGTLARLLLRGVPTLMLPVQIEQNLMAYRARRAGLARVVDLLQPTACVPAALKALLDDGASRIAPHLKAFRRKHAGYHPADAAQEMADICLALAAGGSLRKEKSPPRRAGSRG